MMKTSQRLRRPRGQALVEAAIGTTLFVTVIIFGIHFAEVGFLSLKVQEAAISALWDGTHGPMHLIPVTYGKAGDSMDDAAEEAQARYADFNGLSAVANGPGITQTFTTGSNLTVDCNMNSGVDWAGAIATRLVYRDNEGTACRAQATLGAWRIPTSFLDNNSEGGLYKQQHQQAALTNIQVCSVGRAVGGQCTGSYSMLIDDWGLAGELESSTCNIIAQDTLMPCTNAPFHAAVFGTYVPTVLPIPGAASMLAEATLYWNPLPPTALAQVGLGMKEKTMWISAAGEDFVNFNQIPTLFDPISFGLWPTSPGSIIGITTAPYGIAHVERFGNGACFLGKDCD